MSNSIVISGMGIVCALGSDRETISRALRGRRSGIVPHAFHPELILPFGRVPNRDAFPADGFDQNLPFARHAVAQAMQQAGAETIAPWYPERVAVVMGSSKGRISGLLHPSAKPRDVVEKFPGDTLGLDLAREAGAIGPVLNYPTACATGLTCIIQAIHLLWEGTADMAIAGSTEASGNALVMAGFHNMGALTKEPMRPFHRNRAGFNPGEGASAFVLEREVDARERGARPLARLCGWDFRSDAHHMTAADAIGAVPALCTRRVLDKAGWDPADVDYVNAHGTGTTRNDKVEGKVLRDVFGPPETAPPVSSLKPFIGHLLGGSAGVELGLALYSMQQSFLPPTLNLDDPDPTIDVHHVPSGGLEKGTTRCLKLSLGFGGHIAAVAVELLP